LAPTEKNTSLRAWATDAVPAAASARAATATLAETERLNFMAFLLLM
jgi:hypothetical protein